MNAEFELFHCEISRLLLVAVLYRVIPLVHNANKLFNVQLPLNFSQFAIFPFAYNYWKYAHNIRKCALNNCNFYFASPQFFIQDDSNNCTQLMGMTQLCLWWVWSIFCIEIMKSFPCCRLILSDFSMQYPWSYYVFFLKKSSCMHSWNIQNVHAGSTTAAY